VHCTCVRSTGKLLEIVPAVLSRIYFILFLKLYFGIILHINLYVQLLAQIWHLLMIMAWLGFSTAGVTNHWPPPHDRNYELQKNRNSLLNFLFICLNNLKNVERRNQVFFFKTFILPTIYAFILLLHLGLLFSGFPQHLLTLATHLANECPTDDRQVS